MLLYAVQQTAVLPTWHQDSRPRRLHALILLQLCSTVLLVQYTGFKVGLP